MRTFYYSLKRTCTWLLFLYLINYPLVVNAQNNVPLAPNQSNEYLQGALFFKLKQTSPISKQLSGLSYQERQQALLTAFQFESDYGVVAIKPVFKLLESRYPNLASVYQVQFENLGYTEALLAYLSGRVEIEYAEKIPRRVILPAPQYTPNDPQFSSQWYLDFIEAQEAYWQFMNCSPPGNISSIRIAIIDDAIYNSHEDLAASIWTNPKDGINGIDDDGNGLIDDTHGWDFGDNDRFTDPPISGSCAVSNNKFYHGTHVAGIAAAINDNSLGISSLGGGASIIPIKCGRDNFANCGEAIFNVVDGIEYAIFAGAQIINCSWGGKIYSYTEELIVNTAHTAGIVVVAAAGNEGQESIYYPAAYTNVIAVGATNSSDQITSFSNYGSKIDVMAPGYNILSCLPKNTSDYGTLSGTSMATPLVSGLVAMIMALDNQLTPDEIRDILKSTAENIYSLNASKYTGKLGAGRINAYRAILSVCSSYSRVFDVSSNFQTVCPGQLAHFIAVERKNRPVTNISWLFPGSATIQNPTTLTPAVTYANEGEYDVIFNYTDGYGLPQSMTLKNYVKVRVNSGNFSSEVDNHMYFNQFGNIQFNNGFASAKNNIPHGLIEGVATISNADGNLLFYNIEGNVYNRFHQIMPNGAALHGYSTTQTLIVPAPGTCKAQYYLFTTGSANTTGLFYSVIDMNADNGRGDIIARQIPIPLPAPSANIVNEKMTAVPHCNGTDLWVVFQEDNTRKIWSFMINSNLYISPTSTGIMTPPIVSVTATTEELAGVMKASPAGNRIAVANDLNFSVDVYDFNQATGIMTLYCSTLLTGGGRAYSCEFSPNGNILYIGQRGQVIQLDLTSPNCTSTTVNVGHPTDVNALELGPNGKIYFTHSCCGFASGFNTNLWRYIGCIRSPNTLGLGCDISLMELEMGASIQQSTLANGVISRFINYRRDYLLQVPEHVSKCQGATVTISSNYQGPAPFFHQWYKADGTLIPGENHSSINVIDPGIYELRVTDAGGCLISALVTVTDEIISQLLSPIMEIECGGTLTLDAGPGFTSYLWSTGETTQSIVVSQPGTILIRVTTEHGCESTQEIKLENSCCKVEINTDPFEKEYYSKRYGIIPQGMIKDNSNNYIIAGTSYDKTVANGEPMKERGFTLLSIDQKGNLNWTKKYTIADLYPWMYNSSVILYDQIGFRVEDMRAGPNNFMITCLAFKANGQMVSLVAFLNFSGAILSVREYENSSPGEHLQLNSIDDSYDDVTGAKDGYIVTGTRHDGSNYEIVYLKFLYNGAVAYDNAISFPGVVTGYAHGMESCANIRINNNGLDGYIIAGIHTFVNGSSIDKSLVLMRTFPWGQVNLIKRLNNAYQPGSDFKLLPTTANNGQNRAFLFMYSTPSGTYDQERINLIKFDNNLDIIWAFQYEVATGSDFAHAYDIIETTAGYKILAQNNNTMAVVFDVAGSGVPLTSTLTQTALPLSGGQYLDDFYIESYSDKFIQEGNNWVTTGFGLHQGAGITKWDINNEVSCGNSYEFTNTTITPNIEYVVYSQQGVGYIHHEIEATPTEVELNKYCCDNGQTQETENGCYFTFDFDFDTPCGLNKISITGVNIFGAMGSTPIYSWTLDGNVVSALELPNILNVTNGIHQVCITITYYPGCSKTVCKNITIGPIIDYDTISTCQSFIWYTPDGCDKYYSYEIFGPDNFNFNSLTYGPGCQGWAIHQLNLGEYIINLKDQSGCIKKILHLSVIPGTITKQKDIYLCPGQCKTVDIMDPDFFCQPNNGLFSGDFDDGFTMFYYPPSPQVTFCYPQSGSYEFTTIASNGCSCVVTGNVILYAPCPIPSEPGGTVGTASIDQMGNETYALQVFPNPTTGRVTLKYLGTIQPGATIMLTDLLGKQHFYGPLMEYKELDMSILASGVYMLSVRNGEKLIHQKVVKE